MQLSDGLKKGLSLAVVTVFSTFACVVAPRSEGYRLYRGERTARQAAGGAGLPIGAGFARSDSLFAAEDADTTQLMFPGEERSHLARDITMFVLASAIVGLFIVKVFLEGDSAETPNSSGGKQNPGGGF